MVRKNNEDAVLEAPEHALFGVADGMGGLAAGEVAARLALDTARRAMSSPRALGVLDRYVADPRIEHRRAVFGLLREACEEANRAVIEESERRAGGEGGRMGATLDLVLLVRDRAFFAHAGDGRAYLVRSTATLQLTQDHALYDSLRASGEVRTPRRPARSPLVNGIGLADEVQVDTFFVDIGRGDRVVLVTDGVHGAAESEAEVDRLCHRGGPAEVAEALVKMARDRGGRDNASAVVIQVAERFLSRAADDSPMAQDLTVIAASPIVQDMPTWAVLEMLAAGVEVEVAEGQLLPRVVASDLCAYVLIEGLVDLPDGRCLGASALIFPESLVGVPKDGDLPRVRERARLIRIRSDDFTEVCRHDADLASGLYYRLSRHLALTS